jgi:hypothetical protein
MAASVAAAIKLFLIYRLLSLQHRRGLSRLCPKRLYEQKAVVDDDKYSTA